MKKEARFSPLTVSQLSTLNAYSNLAVSRSSVYVISVPSGKGQTHAMSRPDFSAIPDVFDSLRETAKQYREMYYSDKFKEVTDIVQDTLGEEGAEKKMFDVGVTIDWDGEVHVNYVHPSDSPAISSGQPPGFKDTELHIIVETNSSFGELDKIRDKVNKQVNIERNNKNDTREKNLRELNERMKADASYDKSYQEGIDRAFGHERTMWA